MYSPEDDYTQDEIKALRSYIDGGGKLIAIVDPLNEDITNLYSFFEEYGLSIESGVVVEQDEGMYSYETQYYLAPELKDHPITEPLISNNLRVCTMTSKGIVIDDAASGLSRTDLLMTSRRAFSKKSDYDNISSKEDGDVGGPFSIASIVEKNEGALGLITSNMLFEDDIDEDTLGGNSAFLISMINYMNGEEAGLNMVGKNVSYNIALYQTSFVKNMKIICIVIIPVFIIAAGIIIIIVRNRNIMINIKKRKEVVNEDE